MVCLNKMLVFISDTDPLPKRFSESLTCARAASLFFRARGNCGKAEFNILGQLSAHMKLTWIEEMEDSSDQQVFANNMAF